MDRIYYPRVAGMLRLATAPSGKHSVDVAYIAEAEATGRVTGETFIR